MQAEQMLDSWRGERGILIEADKLIGDALARNPKSAHAMVEKGRLLIMASNSASDKRKPEALAAAETMFRKATEADPRYVRAYTLQGHLYTLTGRLDLAKSALEQADRIGTDDPWQQLNWSAYWQASGDSEKAVSFCEKTIKGGTLKSKALRAAWRCVSDYYRKVAPNREKTDMAFRESVKLEPDSAYLRGDYAQFLALAFLDFGAAENLARETIAIKDYPQVRGTLSLALYAKWARAIEEKKEPAFIAARLAEAQQEDPDGGMLPGCALAEPQMAFLVKALEKRASESQKIYKPLAQC